MQWIILAGLGAVLLALGVLVFAATMASRSKPHRQESITPTQQTGNPYRKFYQNKP